MTTLRPSPNAERIRAMRAAHDNVDRIADVVEAFRDGPGNELGRALLALSDRWPPRNPEAPHDPAPRTP